ncbi:hypothetical protein K523DRAFT_326142 [Schizophyllum commune Tattone D]|nr:hypothetical protein K523DRAFT_326142 [Schizophyllum commune Tattone D]
MQLKWAWNPLPTDPDRRRHRQTRSRRPVAPTHPLPLHPRDAPLRPSHPLSFPVATLTK